MSAGNPDYQRCGNRPASLASCSKPTPSSQLPSLASSITFLLCGSMLQQPEHVLGFVISLPLLNMSLPLPHSVPSLPGKVLYLCASYYQLPSSWSLLLQHPLEVVSCFWPPGCQQHFYIILRESELVLIFSPCLRALESQKTITCSTCFLAHSRSEELIPTYALQSISLYYSEHLLGMRLLLPIDVFAFAVPFCLSTLPCFSLWQDWASSQINLCSLCIFTRLWWRDLHCAMNKVTFFSLKDL